MRNNPYNLHNDSSLNIPRQATQLSSNPRTNIRRRLGTVKRKRRNIKNNRTTARPLLAHTHRHRSNKIRSISLTRTRPSHNTAPHRRSNVKLRQARNSPNRNRVDRHLNIHHQTAHRHPKHQVVTKNNRVITHLRRHAAKSNPRVNPAQNKTNVYSRRPSISLHHRSLRHHVIMDEHGSSLNRGLSRNLHRLSQRQSINHGRTTRHQSQVNIRHPPVNLNSIITRHRTTEINILSSHGH